MVRSRASQLLVILNVLQWHTHVKWPYWPVAQSWLQFFQDITTSFQHHSRKCHCRPLLSLLSVKRTWSWTVHKNVFKHYVVLHNRFYDKEDTEYWVQPLSKCIYFPTSTISIFKLRLWITKQSANQSYSY